LTQADLISKLEKLAGHRILCVGDIMLDRYVYGQVERISPEAPIPVLHIQRETMMLGGAGNVVRNIIALGGYVDLVGVVGQDQGGYELAEQIASLPEIASYVITDNSRPTTRKTRFVADNQQLLRADDEKAAGLSSETEAQLLQRVRGALSGAEIVLLSDYAKGVLNDRTTREIIALARSKDKRVMVDPKGRDYSRYRGAFMLTPNRRELIEATNLPVRNPNEAEAAARHLIKTYDLGGVLAKLGHEGVVLVMKDEEAVHHHTMAREVFDVSGAGDTVIATMALSLAGGLSNRDSAELANFAGSIVVGKVGTATVSREEIVHAMVRDEAGQSEDKIVSLSEAAATAERWRKQGLKVGFTNGVFDLLHPGHLSLLRQAKAPCDKLIVGMNSDSSVKRLKGPARPVQNESARAAVLASLSDVAAVVIFSEDTPIEAIKAIRPDILVKGADYKIDQVVGGELVQAWGGKVVLAQLVEGQSTTATIARMGGTQQKT
jgi:D-beta-D-heptose 7-phosphate kinase/D-beta-D-heptose 1-phosphate adenosyltransferase